MSETVSNFTSTMLWLFACLIMIGLIASALSDNKKYNILVTTTIYHNSVPVVLTTVIVMFSSDKEADLAFRLLENNNNDQEIAGIKTQLKLLKLY